MATVDEIYKCRDSIIIALSQRGVPSKAFAEDLFHDAILDCISKLDKIKTSLCAYLKKTTLNMWYDTIKRQKRERDRLPDLIIAFEQLGNARDESLDVIYDECLKGLAEYHPVQYAVIERRLYGMSHKEIAEELFSQSKDPISYSQQAAKRGSEFLKRCKRTKQEQDGI